MGYHADFLERNLLHTLFEEMRPKGLRSILLAGSGEPLLHPELPEIASDAVQHGVDVALSTNGVLLTKEKSQALLHNLKWVRFSTSGGSEETYHRIHRGAPGDFSRVLRNLEDAARIKNRDALHTVLNVQIVMIPENMHEILPLAREVKARGADRYIVKPVGFVERTQSKIRGEVTNDFYAYDEVLGAELEALSDDRFQVVYRKSRAENMSGARGFDACYGSSFHAMIGAGGEVWQCCNLLGIPEYALGNLHEKSFAEIWDGEARKRFLKRLKDEKMAPCPRACKLAPINQYLHALLHPGEHVNFI